jgi:L-ascorbate metabolism protein UlaG (beta-lactamase superfamily)
MLCMEPETETELQIRRLGWAGIELRAAGRSLVIDLFEDRHAMAPLIEEVTGPLPAPSAPVDVALVTHLHADHADPAAIGRAARPGVRVLRPGPAPGTDLDRAATIQAEQGLATLEAEVEVLEPWETREAGPFRVTAVPAVDGFGDPQVSWVVETAGRRILHGGDTMFHGAWWPIASRFKPFDAVFLPINGPICNFPHRLPPSPFPVAMTPEQAAAAATMLGTELAVPIHYDGIEVPGLYEQELDPAGSFVAAAARHRLESRILAPGELLTWAD